MTPEIKEYCERTGQSENAITGGLSGYGIERVHELIAEANKLQKKLVFYYANEERMAADALSYRFDDVDTCNLFNAPPLLGQELIKFLKAASFARGMIKSGKTEEAKKKFPDEYFFASLYVDTPSKEFEPMIAAELDKAWQWELKKEKQK